MQAQTLLKPLSGIQSGEAGAVLLVNGKGELLYSTRDLSDEGLDFSRGFRHYYLSGRNNDYLVVGESSTEGDFSLVAVMSDKSLLNTSLQDTVFEPSVFR